VAWHTHTQLGGGAALPTMLPAWTLQRLQLAAQRLELGAGRVQLHEGVAAEVADELAAAVHQLHEMLFAAAGGGGGGVLLPAAAASAEGVPPPSPVAVG
jgi:hypothetical protein